MDTDFLDKLISNYRGSREIYEGLNIMNNTSFFSTVADPKPYKLISTAAGNILIYNTILKLTALEAKYIETKYDIKHLFGWTIK